VYEAMFLQASIGLVVEGVGLGHVCYRVCRLEAGKKWGLFMIFFCPLCCTITEIVVGFSIGRRSWTTKPAGKQYSYKAEIGR
jgi:hypothetical protein